MSRRGIFGVALSSTLAVGVAAAGASCNSSSGTVGIADNCSINSDCNSPLICAFARCHDACAQQRDCSAGERCVASTAGSVCQLTSESTCSATVLCQTGQTCGKDGQCRATCGGASGSGCTAGNFCLMSDTAASCFSPGSPADMTALVQAGAIAPDGAVLSDASTLVLPSEAASGGDASGDGSEGADATQGGDAGPGVDSTVGGEAGPGSDAAAIEVCEATLLANGTCDYCPAHACANGTCVSGNHDYSCTCNGGFTGTGTKSCTLVNGCLANNVCPPSNPCAPIASAHGACLGEYSAWPVPDQAAGSLGGGTTVLPSYSDNGDGTISDNVTALMWQKVVSTTGCAAPPADAGPDASAPNECTVAEAEAYCSSLSLAGYSDWRLPYKNELETLLDCTVPNPPHIAAAFWPVPLDKFWTASALVRSPAYGWYVDYGATSGGCGDISWSGTTSTLGARCVRGGIAQSTPGTHYTVNPGAIDAGTPDAAITGDTVTDNWTGLVWARQVASGNLTYPAAASYCTSLGAGFRVPTFKELLTLVDPLAYGPAIDITAFPGTPTGQTWSSTLLYPPASSNTYFSVEFNDGATNYYTSGNGLWVRCVH